MIELFVGKEVMVFDSDLWRKNGGDSPTDDFMRKATILKVYSEADIYRIYIAGNRPEWRVPHTLVDVRFEHDGRISKSHFANAIGEVK